LIARMGNVKTVALVVMAKHHWMPSANVKLVGGERIAISALQLTNAQIQMRLGAESSPVCSQMNVDVKEILKILLLIVQKMGSAAPHGLKWKHVKMMQIVIVLKGVWNQDLLPLDHVRRQADESADDG
jgi:hypothetical protein